MLGTHVPRRIRPASARMNADAVGFSSTRKKKRAARGVVDTLLPSTATRETSSDYSRRVGRRDIAQELQRKARVRRIVAAVIAVAVVAVVAGGVGLATFFGSVDGKMGLGDSDAKAALTAPKEGAWYALLAADLGAATATQEQEGPDALVLARVDASSRAVALVSIPANLQVTLKDGKVHPLREAAAQGDAALVSAVAGFAGVDIAHYAKADAAGIASLVDHLGGVEVDVTQEVDDPAAGDTYLAPGVQTLDGNAAVTFLRARNFANGIDDQAQNQRAFLASLAARMLEDGGALAFALQLDAVGGSFSTDVPAVDALKLAGALGGIDAASVQGALVPGYESTRDGATRYVASSNASGGHDGAGGRRPAARCGRGCVRAGRPRQLQAGGAQRRGHYGRGGPGGGDPGGRRVQRGRHGQRRQLRVPRDARGVRRRGAQGAGRGSGARAGHGPRDRGRRLLRTRPTCS